MQCVIRASEKYFHYTFVANLESAADINHCQWWKSLYFHRSFPIKHLLVLKTSSRNFHDMSWRRLQHVFSVTISHLPTRPEGVLKTSWKLLRRRKIVMLKTSLRRLKDMSSRRLEDISHGCLEDVPWRCLGDIMERKKILDWDIGL